MLAQFRISLIVQKLERIIWWFDDHGSIVRQDHVSGVTRFAFVLKRKSNYENFRKILETAFWVW